MARKAKRYICEAHEEIIDIAEEILLEPEHRLKSKLHKIIRIAREAKAYGQSMEDRLSLYRESIEELGFKRNRV